MSRKVVSLVRKDVDVNEHERVTLSSFTLRHKLK